MESNQSYKNKALASLQGKWTVGVVATLIVFLITGGASSIFTAPLDETSGAGASGIWALLCLPLSWGFTVFFLNLIRQEDVKYSRLFDGYKDCVRIGVTEFLMGFFTLLGCFFFLIPGIIIALMISQTEFIMKDDKEIGYLDAMKRSADMMKGHKAELFWLIISFIGWAILSCLTLGFGFLLLIPYYYTTMAHFYEDLKAEKQLG